MSLSPLDSFQSRFVTYLLNFPRKLNVSNKHKMSTINQKRNLLRGFSR